MPLTSKGSYASGAANESIHNTPALNNVKIYLGQVIKVYYRDQPSSLTKIHTEYDVMDTLTQQVIPHCVSAEPIGGQLNYSEVILSAGNKGDSNEVNFAANIGDMCIVAFIAGARTRPVIIARYPHVAKVHGGIQLGSHLDFEYNGVHFNIDKDGQFTLTHSQGTTIAIDSSGELDIKDSSGNQIQLDPNNKSASIASDNLNLGAISGTEAVILGDTYRTNESAMHREERVNLESAITACTTAATALQAPAVLSAPGPVLAVLVAALTASFTGILAAHNQFEAEDGIYKSKKVKVV